MWDKVVRRGETGMFRGATLVNLDSKGRLTVPTRYREQLIESATGQMVCTIDIHHPACCFTPCLNGKLLSKSYLVCRA